MAKWWALRLSCVLAALAFAKDAPPLADDPALEARMQRIAPAHVDSPFEFSFAVPARLPRPLLVVRDYHWPACVGRGGLALLASYSGNTEETLAAAAGAQTTAVVPPIAAPLIVPVICAVPVTVPAVSTAV